MLPVYLVLAVLLAPAAAPAQEQEAVSLAREAVPQASVAQAEPAQEGERRAVPRGSRPQGDNPRTGTAVPRTAPQGPPPAAERPSARNRGRTVGVRPPAVYNYYYPNRYYYPRRAYPYGYNSFGFGYLYYDPYRSYPGYAYGPGYGYGSGYYGRPFSAFDIGELRLNVSPRHAQVFVDGYYAGTVDDYDGAFQALKLESGAYRIELVAPGYEPLTFDVRLTPGQKITYRGELRRY